MSLSRSASVNYAAAGEESCFADKLYVRSNVRVPETMDTRGRSSFQAEDAFRRRHRGRGISVRLVAVLAFVTLLAMLVTYGKAVNVRTTMMKNRETYLRDIQQAQVEIEMLRGTIANACESTRICYQAVQRLGMVASQGAETVEILAPETRTNRTEAFAQGVLVAGTLP